MKDKKNMVCYKNPFNLLWIIPLIILWGINLIFCYIVFSFVETYYSFMMWIVRDKRPFMEKYNNLLDKLKYKKSEFSKVKRRLNKK